MPGISPVRVGDSLADTVLVSNRGPLSFRFEGGRPVAGVSAGGLAGSLQPLVTGTGATWVACALGDADRVANAERLTAGAGVRLELLEPDPAMYRLAYDVVSNATLWFCHHHLFDAARRPRSDGNWAEAWEAYRRYNRLFADRVASVAPEGGRVLVQDYHLALLGSELRRARPDLRTVHFSHTPFADPSVMRMLPSQVADDLLTGMAGYHARGFHSDRWSAGYRACQRELGPGRFREMDPGGGDPGGGDPFSSFTSTLSPDPDRLAASAAEPAVRSALDSMEQAIGGTDRRVIVRVDRMELSKNLLRGFWAFGQLLEDQPHWRERVVFFAMAYPSRQGVPEYIAYRQEVESAVARINERWATPGWDPIILSVEDDYPRSVAALTRYDVLLVNPVRDGLNLVAKEGPLLNTTDGVVALSREAGAFEELWPGVLEVNPFDVAGTASVLARALEMESGERATMAKTVREIILDRPPRSWLDDQLDAAG
ncbi:MAG: alpha,alpha-trehalose-phosphate synthase (UDP-forming) [Acidimicrobiales bacterium]